MAPGALDRRRGQNDGRAFTMVEIVVVVLILMIGIIPVYQTMVQSSQETRFNRQRTFAASLAANVIELYKQLDQNELEKEAGNLEGYLDTKKVKDDSGDPIMYFWCGANMKAFIAANPKANLTALRDAFKREVVRYTIKPEFKPVTGDPALKGRLGAMLVRVLYKADDKREITVTSSMVLSKPHFPIGKK